MGLSICVFTLVPMKMTSLFEPLFRLAARALLSFAVLATLSSSSVAACHVVKEGGSGKADGSNWNNALPDLPVSLARGDVYVLATGNYGAHHFNDPDAGDKQIEVRAATTASHCSDTGWNPSYVGPAVFRATKRNAGNVLSFSTDFYLVNGVYRSTSTGQPFVDWKSGYGFKIDNSNQFACGSDIGGGNPGGPSYVHDIALQYLEVSGSHDRTSSCTDDEIAFGAGSFNLRFQYLYVHDAGNNNFLLAGNHGHPGGGAGYGPGTNVRIEDSFVSYDCCTKGAHGQACQCSEGLQNLTIAHNIFANMVSTAFIATASAAGYNSGNGPNGPWYIYGNVFLSDDPKNCAVGDGVLAVWDATFTDNIYFLNNTIANLGTRSCPGQLNTGFGLGLGMITHLKELIVENNLWWNCDVITVIPTGTRHWNGAEFASVTWSHNAYFRSHSSSGTNDSDRGKQVSTTDPFMNSSAFDFRLGVHTDTGSGTSTSVPANDIDLLQRRRGTENNWDRGAFQQITR